VSVLETDRLRLRISAQLWGQGYAFESASAVMASERRALGLDRIVAMTSPDNLASIKVLKIIGMRFERRVKLSKDKPEINLFAAEF